MILGADESVDAPIVERLRRDGHDVVRLSLHATGAFAILKSRNDPAACSPWAWLVPPCSGISPDAALELSLPLLAPA